MTNPDKVLFIAILLISCFMLVYLECFAFIGKSDEVIVTVDGKKYASYNFSEINKPIELDVKTKYGENKIRINSDNVRVISSDCPNKLDVKAGPISKPHQSIICAPHHLCVYISSNSSDIDAVSY